MIKFTLKIPFCIAFLIAAMVVSGCGGSSTPTISKAEFLRQGDEICSRAEAKRGAAIQAYAAEHKLGPQHPLNKQGQEQLVTTVALPPLKAELEELKKLGTPSGDGAKAEAVLDALEEAIAQIEAKPSVALSGTPFAAAAKTAAEYGFKVCGQT